MTDIQPGHYAQKQLLSPSGLVRWSHGSRFRLARELVAPFAGRPLLDYGCGDGTFLALVQDLFPDGRSASTSTPVRSPTAPSASPARPASAFLRDRRRSRPATTTATRSSSAWKCSSTARTTCRSRVLDQIFAADRAAAARSSSACRSRSGRRSSPSRARARSSPCAGCPSTRRASAISRRARAHALRRRGHARSRAKSTKAIAAARFTGHKGFNWRRLQRTIERRFVRRADALFSPLAALRRMAEQPGVVRVPEAAGRVAGAASFPCCTSRVGSLLTPAAAARFAG